MEPSTFSVGYGESRLSGQHFLPDRRFAIAAANRKRSSSAVEMPLIFLGMERELPLLIRRRIKNAVTEHCHCADHSRGCLAPD
jgi:hypothetical protein